MLPSPQFHTPNLVFRAPELTDRPWLLQLAMAPDVLMKASAGVTKPVSTEVEHPDNVKFWERLQGFLLSIVICLPKSEEERTAPGERIGYMILMEAGGEYGKHHRQAEFGMFMGPNGRGQGHGTTSLLFLLEQAFLRFNLHKVIGSVFEWNGPAWRCYQKAGFQEEARRREQYWQEGEWRDELIIGITVDEWHAQQAEKKKKQKTLARSS